MNEHSARAARQSAVAALICIVWALAGCAADSGTSGGDPLTQQAGVFANRVVAYAYAGTIATCPLCDPLRTLGAAGGSVDVASLGDNRSGEGGSIILGLGDPTDATSRQCIVNGAGADFTVFENPFAFSDSSGSVNFTEAAFVEVSEDDSLYYRFAATFPDPTDPMLASLVGDPANYANLAGINTLADGGDRFDLADVIATHTLAPTFRACFVRMVDGGADVPDYDSHGEFGTMDPTGADIDAVEAIHFEPAPGLTP